MHLPDGFISIPVAVTTGILSGGVLFISFKQSLTSERYKHASILGLTTAFIFSAQMINFPVIAGTSGHLLGGGLAGILLGNPWSAIQSISTVLIIQAVLFADGGITALGANILNMGIISVWISWLLTKTLHRLMGGSKKYLPIAGGFGAGISVIGTSIACGIQLALSGTSNINLVLPAIAGIHLFIGLGEGVITWSILSFLVKVRPDLLPGEEKKFHSFLIPIVLIFFLSGILSLFASAYPDGLETVAESLGFSRTVNSSLINIETPFSKYEINGLGDIGKSITGLLGSFICFFMAFNISKILKYKDA